MTKSSLELAREALIVASSALLAYASRFSRKDFILPQRLAALALHASSGRPAITGPAPAWANGRICIGCSERVWEVLF